MKTAETIIINEIVRETEKAVLVSAQVTWNYNKWIAKEMWMPKSVIVVAENGKVAEVASWFIEKTCRANAFHGYDMKFERPVTINA